MWVPNTDPSVCAVDDNGQKSIIFKDALGNPVAVSPENPLPMQAQGAGAPAGLKNIAGDQINPATEEKQDSAIALLAAIETNTQGGGGAVGGATEAKQDVLIALNEMTTYLKWVLSSLQMPRNADPANNADQVSVINTITANVSAITTLTNLQQFNGEQAHLMSVASEINAWANMQRSTIS